MKLTPNFYRDRVCLNVLAGSKMRGIFTRRRKDTCWLVCCQKITRMSQAQ